MGILFSDGRRWWPGAEKYGSGNCKIVRFQTRRITVLVNDKMKTCYSLFSGCGGSDEGMKNAGFVSLGGVEKESYPAKLFSKNHTTVTPLDISEVDNIPHVDLLWISPPCPSFSGANVGGSETKDDIAIAENVSRLILSSTPKAIALENVGGYKKSESLRIIVDTVSYLGMSYHLGSYNAADYGAPTKRNRMILRAGMFNPVRKTHSRTRVSGLLPSRSWYDVLPTDLNVLETTQLTLVQKSVYKPTGPYMIERLGYRKYPKVYSSAEPSPTIRSHQYHDHRYNWRTAHTIVVGESCYKPDIQCLAAWQGFPDDYYWGEDRVLAVRAIGNAVPPQLAQAIADSFIFDQE